MPHRNVPLVEGLKTVQIYYLKNVFLSGSLLLQLTLLVMLLFVVGLCFGTSTVQEEAFVSLALIE